MCDTTVTINYEDREQVERLGKDFHESDHIAPWHDLHQETRAQIVDALQAALREFADPKPRIEEPTGWLSVVEDGMGVQWYRWSVRPQDADKAWISVMDEGRCYPTGFDQIDAVRAVAPGVEVAE